MTCMEAQGLITLFIHKELDKKTLKEFLNHMEHCDSCKEELEVYYILLTSMKQMDNDEPLSADFHKQFLNELERSNHYLINQKNHIFRQKVLMAFLIGGVSVLFGVSLGKNEALEEGALTKDGVSVASQYQLKFRFSNETRHVMYEKKLPDIILNP